MRQLFLAIFLTSLVLPLQAQRSGPPSPSASVPEKEEVAKKTGDSRTFFQRMFGTRPKATPTPAPTPAPKAVVKRRPKPKAPTEEPTPDATAKVTPKKRPAAAVPPTPEVPSATAPTTTAKVKPAKVTGKKGAPVTTDSTGLDDATKFRNAKAKALEDAHVKDLKSKADGEVNEAEAHKALLNYNKALFQKIREVDPSVSDYSGKVEQSMTKRLSSEKGKE